MPGRAEQPATDEALLAACQRGEQAAWNALVDRYSALIYSIPLKLGLSEHDAADVFQSVCLALVEKMAAIRDPRGLPAWLMTTTTRQCWAVLRQRQRELSVAGGADVVEVEPPDPDPLPDEEILSLERQHVVRTAVAHLPANCRTLLEALFSDSAQSMSYQELAETLGVPLNSLGPTRARCLAKLKRLLDDAGFF
ncbi:MAG TPA: sigma-70 family RNA polymerase sigma factor [Chloroflexota bacterium]